MLHNIFFKLQPEDLMYLLWWIMTHNQQYVIEDKYIYRFDIAESIILTLDLLFSKNQSALYGAPVD